MPRFVCVLLILVLTSITCLADDNLQLKITVSGASPNHGNAVLSLFDSSATHLREPVMSLSQKINEKGEAEFNLSGMEDHFYSISVFYDKDENGKLNTGFLGIPTELVGFSNNAKGSFGPPSFEQTKFKPSLNSQIEIRLIGAAEEV